MLSPKAFGFRGPHTAAAGYVSFGRSRLRAHAKRVPLRSSKEFFLRHLSLEKTRFNADAFPKNLTVFRGVHHRKIKLPRQKRFL